MDATKFYAMRSDPRGGGGGGAGGVSDAVTALLAGLRPRERAADVCGALSTWTSLAVTQCFSRVRGRPQFDEEHQRSLLSCHSADDDGVGHEEAMLELRRRVQKVDLPPQARPHSFAQELEATYNRHKAMQRSESAGTATTSRAAAASRRREKAASADAALLLPSEPEPLGALWSDSDRALHDILAAKGLSGAPSQRVSEPGKAEDLRRLSVEELLALRMPSPTSTVSIPEKTGADNDDDEPPEVSTYEGRALRAWLEAIDASRASEFVAYARSFEQQGFLTLDDLAQLDENDVEQAMSEVGISKFAHRARIRKAILRLPLEGAASTDAPAFVKPALAG